jgi:SAM-dependent methyltransferase
VRDLTPFADAAFDYVQASNVLDYVPEMAHAIGAVHRVLRPSGVFVLLIPQGNLLKGDAPLVASIRTSVSGSYWPKKMDVPYVQVGRKTLAAMLRHAGFEAREIKIEEPLSGLICTWWLCLKT